MMSHSSKQIDIQNILSFCDDLVEVLRSKRDVNNFSLSLKRSSSMQSSFTADFEDVQSSILDCEKKIDGCKQKTDEARSNVVADEEIDDLEKVLDEELCREDLLRAEVSEIEKQIDDLDQQRLLIEERRRNLKKLGLDVTKAHSKLSFYASVTNIIPNVESGSKISGQIVNRDSNVVECFEIDPLKEDTFDTCNSIWEMIDR